VMDAAEARGKKNGHKVERFRFNQK
jgi:hypothetical protein